MFHLIFPLFTCFAHLLTDPSNNPVLLACFLTLALIETPFGCSKKGRQRRGLASVYLKGSAGKSFSSSSSETKLPPGQNCFREELRDRNKGKLNGKN